MITDDKITEIICATDEFSKKFDEEIENPPCSVLQGPMWMTGTRRYGLYSAREYTGSSLLTGDGFAKGLLSSS